MSLVAIVQRRPSAAPSVRLLSHGGDGMTLHSGWSEIEQARAWARELEDREMAKGKKLPDARAAVAIAAGVPRGSLEHLRRGRMKTLTTRLLERLRAALVAEITKEVSRLEHQLFVLRQSGRAPREDVVASAQAHVDAAKAVLMTAAFQPKETR